MKKSYRTSYLIDVIKGIVYLLGGLALLVVGIVLLSNDSANASSPDPAIAQAARNAKLGDFGFAFFGAILIVIALFGFYWISALKKELTRKAGEGFDAKMVRKYGILDTIIFQSPFGVCAYKEWKARKALQDAKKGNASNELFAEERPQFKEGYDAEKNTVIRLVAKKNSTKAYQTRGIEDIGSKNNWKGWLYLAPVVILVAVFLIYPLINTIFISFTDSYNYSLGTFKGLTFNNFTYILGLTPKITSAGEAWEHYFVDYAIPNTLICVVVTVPVSTALALLISVALNSIKWFQKILQTIFFLPYVTNGIAVGMVFAVIFDSNGIINFLFNMKDFAWIRGAPREIAMIPLCMYIVWSSIPFKILIFLSGLQGIDKQYYQAAQIDSAPKSKVLMRVTVPLLSPQILYILITSFIGAWKEYTSVVGLFNGPGTLGTAGAPNMETIVYYVYENLSQQTSSAAAAAVFLFVIILLFTALQFAISKKRVHY